MEFSNLPTEVQQLIFDGMTFRTRLTASRVCRTWHRLAFATKFLQQVQLTLEIRESQCLAEAIAVLQQSEREYRRLRLVYQGNTQQSLVSLTELLETVRGIRELDLLFFFYCFREKLNIVINEVLSECGSLESFTIGIRGRLMSWIGKNRPAATAAVVDLEKEEPRFPALTSLVIKRNPDLLHPRFYEISQSLHSPTFYVPPEPETLPNLRHLTMNCETAAQLRLFAHCAERLETAAIVSFDGQGRFVEPFLDLRLPQVQSLSLPGFRRSDTRKLCQFLKALRRVTVLQMEQVLIDSEVIETIFEHCSTLKHLVLYMEWLSAGCLRNITRLEKLEKLKLVGKVQNGWVNHENYFQGAVGGQLRLDSLTISHFVFTSGDFVASIASIFINLHELRILDCRAKNNIIGPIAEGLWFLRSLEYNKVTHGGVRPVWSPFLNHVKLVNCAWASGDFLNKLIEQCPRLRRLSLSACGASREAVQKILPLIFNYLPFTDRLRAALVCHQWNSLIWHSNAFRQRTWLTLRVKTLDFLATSLKQLAESNRHYARLRIKFIARHDLLKTASLPPGLLTGLTHLRHVEICYDTPCVEEDWDVVNYRLLKGCDWLESLSLEFSLLASIPDVAGRAESTNRIVKALIERKKNVQVNRDAIEPIRHGRMRSLTTLRVHPPTAMLYQNESKWIYPASAYCYRNVTKLEIYITFDYQADLVYQLRHQLQSLNLLQVFPERSVDRIKGMDFPLLERLTINCHNVQDMQLVDNLPKLKYFDPSRSAISTQGITKVARTCPNLLEFGVLLDGLQENELMPLLNMTRMNKLTLRVSSSGILLFDYFQNASKTQTFDHLTDLTLHNCTLSGANPLSAIPRRMPNLKSLTLRSCHTNMALLDELPTTFPCLTQLKLHHLELLNVTAFRPTGSTVILPRALMYGEAWKAASGSWSQRVLVRALHTGTPLNGLLFRRLYKNSPSGMYRIVDATGEKWYDSWR